MYIEDTEYIEYKEYIYIFKASIPLSCWVNDIFLASLLVTHKS